MNRTRKQVLSKIHRALDKESTIIATINDYFCIRVDDMWWVGIYPDHEIRISDGDG